MGRWIRVGAMGVVGAGLLAAFSVVPRDAIARDVITSDTSAVTDGRPLRDSNPVPQRTLHFAATPTGVSSASMALTGPLNQLPRGIAVLLAPTVDLTAVNPGVDIERSACVTVAIRANAAYECGDLRLTYTMPAIRVFNQARAVNMLYNSQHARPAPIVRAIVRRPVGGAQPQQVEMKVWLNTVNNVMKVWDASTWKTGDRRQLAVSFDASDMPTNLYGYNADVTFIYSDGTRETTRATGELAIVNRSKSEFGPGWWVAGYERVIWQPGDHLYWIGGDGSTRRYNWVGYTTNSRRLYTARKLDGVDSMTSEGAGANQVYYRHLSRGAYITFDASGRHTATVNSLGQITSFPSLGVCGLLSQIVPPVPAGQPAKMWMFQYDTDNAPSPCATPAHVTNIAASASADGTWRWTQRFLSTFSGSFVRFGTGAVVAYTTSDERIVALTDVRGTTTTFHYTPGGMLDTARTPTGVGSSVVTQVIRAGEGVALDGPKQLHQVATVIKSPRNPGGDSTTITLGPWGNPLTVVDALNRATEVVPDDVFPLLPKRITAPSGHSTFPLYNAYGKVRYVNATPDPVNTPSGPDAANGGVAPETYYYYDANYPDNLTATRDAVGLITSYSYTSFNGLYPVLTGQQTGSSILRRASFTYCWTGSCYGLPSVSESPANAQGVRSRDSVFYDALGNLSRTISADGKCSEFLNDGIGRTIQSRVRVAGSCRAAAPPPPPPTCTKRICPLQAFAADVDWVLTENFYDSLDRDTLTLTTALSPTTQVLETRTSYAGFSGLPTVVTRYSTPDHAVGTLRDEMVYDALGRLTRRFAQGANRTWPEEMWYDAAGNDTMHVTARRDTIRMQYDALNRITTRIVPAIRYAARR
jgi:YD repeat-containing protein